MTKLKRIVMAWGGSGGHVFPIKSLIDFLGENKEIFTHVDAVYRFGNRQALEYESFQDVKSPFPVKLQFVSILSGKFRRETKIISWIRNIRDVFLFVFGIVEAVFKLIYYRIDIVFCKGGHVALPVVIAAFLLRKKIVVHESDVKAGLTNRIAAKCASVIFTGFPWVFKDAKVLWQILSDDLLDIETIENKKIKAIKKAKEHNKKPLILVLWGSLGSTRLYRDIKIFLQEKDMLAKNFERVIVGGFLNRKIDEFFVSFKNVTSFDFLSQKEMGQLCSLADIGITRAGTTSLAEQKLFDMKLLIVPISRTHDQYLNANYYVKKYKDILIDQKKDFQIQLKDALHTLRNYKKHLIYKERNIQIKQIKKKIWKNILW